MSKRLEGRVAVITGAGSGIGYATALRLASEGAKVVVADTNEQSGNKVATEVGGLFVKCDVTNEAQVANLYKVALIPIIELILHLITQVFHPQMMIQF